MPIMTTCHRGSASARVFVLFRPRLLAAVCLALFATAAQAADGIHVTGHGSLEVAPDIGTVRLHVRFEGADPGALKNQLDDIVTQVLKLAERLDIRPQDVAATLVSIQPRYQRRGSDTVVDGVVGTRTISVKLRNLDLFGTLLNEALAMGINNVDPLVLDSSRRRELEQEALDLAMVDALELADRVAEGFGVSRGEVLDVHVTAHSVMPTREIAAFSAARDSSPFSAGVIRIERTVQATFAVPGGT
jgi:uncharacterized protein YggE